MFDLSVSHDPSVVVTISWYHANNLINTTVNDNFILYENGSLGISEVNRELAGAYRCEITSEVGDDNAEAMLTVQGHYYIILYK